MGAARWTAGSSTAYAAYAHSTASFTPEQRFTSRGIDPLLDPTKFKQRESRDSSHNPRSRPIIVALDVTGSMGSIPNALLGAGLQTLVTEVVKRKTVEDPHFMMMGIGDASCDEAPIQATQFEADDAIIPQMAKIFLEGNGGGNDHESYDFAWLFAAARCVTDSFEKRKKKGYLFTIGDEMPPSVLTAQQITRFMGDGMEKDVDSWQSLTMAKAQWNVFHIIAAQGSYSSGSNLPVVETAWRKALKQNVIVMRDYTKLPEIIVSAIQVAEGDDHDAVAKSWGTGTDLVVRDAIATVTKLESESVW